MKLFEMTSLVSVVPVSNYEKALAWYSKWLGEPDEIPMEGMAEWEITANAWLQLDASSELSDKANLVIGVNDVSACRNALLAAGVDATKIIDYEVVKVCDVFDPDGNRISFAQVTA